MYALGEAVALANGRGRYGVGWDGRKTSALLARTVSSAVNSVGSDVASFGQVPTPVIAFGTRSRSCKAGFAVTASHNPAEFSGVKIFNQKGMELPTSDEERIARAMSVEVMRSAGSFGDAFVDEGVADEYVSSLVSRHERQTHPLRIAVDCSCGPGGLITPRVLQYLGHTVLAVNAQVSWRFPARPPEPTGKNLEDFSNIVMRLGVDLGLAHDGDADRVVMVNRNGKVVPDSVLAILAMRAMNLSTGAAILSENTSNAVAEEATTLGLTVVRSRVGKSFASVESQGGVFAAEPSKIVDPKWGLWEDGINAAALVTGLLANDRGLLDRVTQEVPWSYRQVNFDSAVRMPLLKDRVRELFKKYRIVYERELDGFKVGLYGGSWVMFRQSGTEPKVRLYCESKDAQMLDVFVQLGSLCIESSK